MQSHCPEGLRALGLILSCSLFLMSCSSGTGSDDDGDEASSGESSLCESPTDLTVEARVIATPPAGQLYHGVFPGGHEEWGEEDDLTLQDVQSYEAAAGKSVAWVYFSHNWFRDHAFPQATVEWIQASGSTPFIRLMLRSSAEQNRRERTYTLQRIIDGEFDADLCGWAQAARDFGEPLLAEFGTEVNGEWFSWNGIWNGGEKTGGYGDDALADGPERFRDAYRHIVDLVRSQGAHNISWVFHVDAQDAPEEEWNRFENYYPGDDWMDWVGVSVYGAAEPTDDEWIEFRQPMDDAYSRLEALTDKPIAVLEFGVTNGHPTGHQADWARAALSDLIARRWPRVIGLSWWNEGWENDNNPAHDTDMWIQNNPELSRAFQDLVGSDSQVLGRPLHTRREVVGSPLSG